MMTPPSLKRSLLQVLLLTLSICARPALADNLEPAKKTTANQNSVLIENAWVRPTSKGQDVSSAYMTLTSKQDTTLIKVTSSVTKEVEIHSMTMEKGIMKMRMLESLPLIAGKPYKLEPGGFHLMLFDLKKPLTQGDSVSFELTLKNKNGTEFTQRIKAEVKTENNGNTHHEHHH